MAAEFAQFEQRRFQEPRRRRGLFGAIKDVSRIGWMRIVAVVVAIHLIVNVVLIAPVLTLVLTVGAAAWLARSAKPGEAARQGAILGGVVAFTGLIVMGWFGFTALAWCGVTIAAGWLAGHYAEEQRG
jgi:hypothetical protein